MTEHDGKSDQPGSPPAPPTTAPARPARSGARPAAEILAALQALDQRLDRHLAETASCSKEAFDRLYAEMRQYKDDFVRAAQRPLLADVIALYDSVRKLRRHYERGGAVEVEALCANLGGLLAEAEEVLARRELVPFAEPGDKLNRETQRALQTVPTTDPAEDMRVVERHKTGFLLGKSVFRREEVVVKKYSPAP